MTHPTISTSDLCRRLRLTVSNEFLLTHLEVKPTEVIKGNPRWSIEKCAEIAGALAEHFARVQKTFTILAKQPAKVAATVDDDDDEL